MPKVGFEPTRAYAHYALNVARLPIPPLRRLAPVYQGLSWSSAETALHFTRIPGFVNLRFEELAGTIFAAEV